MLCWLCFFAFVFRVLWDTCTTPKFVWLSLFVVLIENGVWVSPEGVRFHGFGFRVTYKLRNSTSQKRVKAVLGRQYSLKHGIT